MKSLRSASLLTVLFVTAGVVVGDSVEPSDFKSPAARNAMEVYTGTLSKLSKDYKERCNLARKTCVAQLTTAQQAATKAGNLDEAVKLRDAAAKLNAEIQEASATAGHGGGLAGERQKLSQALANTVWQTGETKIRFNEDGTGNFMEGSKPDAAKPAWAWVAISGREAFIRYSSGWTNRMEFDDGYKSYILLESGNGKKLDVPGGKLLQ